MIGDFSVSLAKAQAILKSFNTWSFKREQPSDAKLLLRVVQTAVACRKPIPFVLYWGKGPRSRIASPDLECLRYLVSIRDRVGEVHEPAATIHLVLTDTHAQLNGHSKDVIDQYFTDISAAAKSVSFKSGRLSDIVQGIGDCEAPTRLPDGETLKLLEKTAAKWYRGEGTSTDGALRYYQLNMIEKRAMELKFPDTVFLTFNGSDCRFLFPDQLPIFYMYSLRKGFSVKPWFLPAPNQNPGPSAGTTTASLHGLQKSDAFSEAQT